MTYQVIYSILPDEEAPWWAISLGLLALACGSFVGSRWLTTREIRQLAVVFSVLFLVVAAGWSVASLSGYQPYTDAERVLRENRALVVEGPVENFEPEQFGGSKDEQFTVQQVVFRYSSSDLSNPGYKQASGLTGPLRPGLPVRVHYFHDPARDQNIILKLEIKK